MNANSGSGVPAAAWRENLERGRSFLIASQLPSGSWDMTCRVEGSAPAPANGLFSTTAVLLSVGQLLPDEVVQRALDFVISCRNPSGNWFFDVALDIPDDADDTACGWRVTHTDG